MCSKSRTQDSPEKSFAVYPLFNLIMPSCLFQVEVKGMPRVTRILEEAVAVSGRDVRLEAEFCSDPEPLTVSVPFFPSLSKII